jgi:hypothetical protein
VDGQRIHKATRRKIDAWRKQPTHADRKTNGKTSTYTKRQIGRESDGQKRYRERSAGQRHTYKLTGRRTVTII